MKVSIIIPTVGRETLAKVLKALFLNNNFDQINPEIIIIFDGIEPNIPAEIDGKLIQVHKTPVKVGASGARNFGIEKSTGDLIVFIGDDTIPASDWLEKITDWHEENPSIKKVLLGKVEWTTELEKDPFHQWLSQNAQFDFGNLDSGEYPSWRHFYTSNISLKRAFIGEERFSEKFSGWGFEDTEFGYRLAKKRMKIFYDKDVKVFHDHEQTLESVIKQTKEAHDNALVFEELHGEVKILPRGLKKMTLQILIFVSAPFSFIEKVGWWRAWKKAWVS